MGKKGDVTPGEQTVRPGVRADFQDAGRIVHSRLPPSRPASRHTGCWNLILQKAAKKRTFGIREKRTKLPLVSGRKISISGPDAHVLLAISMVHQKSLGDDTTKDKANTAS
ncbi:hypothetical protein RRG08_006740 [Elysia crispata]|uniref:Uncharacterized protein n=1 Tax=Elysia crispata TaxID=231223 RepID=A0AAE0XTF1_9GAST|nr:hypothetical protein RRG08_006740 [Elysia crispata]